jgi:GDP-4-dehydro-6-deoxy-D-mannose reductase
LVTGAGGYLGTRLLDALSHYVTPECKVPAVFGLSRSPVSNTQTGPNPIQIFQGDVAHPELARLLEELQPDVVFHLAAAPPEADWETHQKDTIEATRHLLETLYAVHPQCRVIIPGSYLEYGDISGTVDETCLTNPKTEWTYFKAMQGQLARLYLQTHGLAVVPVRLFEFFGGNQRQSWVSEIAAQVVLEEKRYEAYPKIRPLTKEGSRDILPVSEVVRALLALGEKGRGGEIYQIASGQTTAISTVIQILLRHAKLKHFQILPKSTEPLSTLQGRINKINVHTGWQPQFSLEEELIQELAYWRVRHQYLSEDN